MQNKISNKTNRNAKKIQKIKKSFRNPIRLSKKTMRASSKVIFIRMLKYFFIIFLWGLTTSLIAFLYFAHDLPELNKLDEIQKVRKVTVVNEDNEILINYGDLYGEYVFFNQIPKHLIEAVIATEDRRFFSHFGIDPIGFIRAIYVNYRAGRIVQGGSTISQQLAKIIYLSPKKTFKRKIQELILAVYIENKLSKEQIIEAYLNRVYLGSGIYGVDAAAKYYFGKNTKDISIKEAAIITGLLKAPSRYSPTINTENSGKRAFQVLYNMVAAGYLTKQQVEVINAEPVFLETSAFGNMQQSYFASWILDQVNSLIPDNGENLIVYTSINDHIQDIVNISLNKFIKKYGSLKNINQGAIVVMKADGTVIAMVGGKNFAESPFNRATQALRQPSSAFKHVVYMTAFENGYNPDDIEKDEPIHIGKWHPRNSSRKFYGDVTIREAFAKSINTIAIKLTERVGRDKVIKTAKSLGINSTLSPHPSLALGSVEVNLLELTGSYAVIANNGFSVDPFGILQIVTENGEVLFSKSKKQNRVISQKTIDYTKDILANTVNYGSGHRAKLDGDIKAFGKTGTSQDNRDAWFVGFSEELVIGVWVGNDNNSPTKTGGSYLPAIIWKEIMQKSITSYQK